MSRDWLAGCDAGLLKRRLEPADRAHFLPVARQHRMRLEPIEREQPKPVGDRRALRVVGGEVEPVAVADLVERQAMREVAHPMPPFQQIAVADSAQPFVEAPQRLSRIGHRGFGLRRLVAIDAKPDGLIPVEFARPGSPPPVDSAWPSAPTIERHLLADRRVAEIRPRASAHPCRR